MENWKHLEIETKEVIEELRQNQDERNSSEYIKRLLTTVMETLKQELANQNETIPMEMCLGRIQDLKEAYASGDIIFLADVLEYEILDMLYYLHENTKVCG